MQTNGLRLRKCPTAGLWNVGRRATKETYRNVHLRRSFASSFVVARGRLRSDEKIPRPAHYPTKRFTQTSRFYVAAWKDSAFLLKLADQVHDTFPRQRLNRQFSIRRISNVS